MDEGWVEVSNGRQVAAALALTNVDALALDRLLLAPAAARFVRVEREPLLPDGSFGYALPRTRWFFNVSACRELRGDALVALAVYFTTRSAPAAAVAAAFRKVADNLTLLSEEEYRVVRLMIRSCPGNAYEVPVVEDELRARFRGSDDELDDLLDALQEKGVIAGRRGGRVQLVL